MGSRVPTGIEPGTTLIPYISHLSVFYSPGENCDSLPAHTKLSGGKMDPRIVTGRNDPTKPKNTLPVQETPPPGRVFAEPKWIHTIVKVGGRC